MCGVKRELGAYFSTPLAYVFIVIFLALNGTMTFFMGAFFERGQADLQSFFSFHPWIYLFLIPAVAMRLWAEERKTGTFEVLMTMPLRTWEIVLGKFIAAVALVAVQLLCLLPIVAVVGVVGDPDFGPILGGLLGW